MGLSQGYRIVWDKVYSIAESSYLYHFTILLALVANACENGILKMHNWRKKKHNIYVTMVLFVPSLVTFEVLVMCTDLQSMLMYATAMKGRSRSL